jgi:hypothetical protein
MHVITAKVTGHRRTPLTLPDPPDMLPVGMLQDLMGMEYFVPVILRCRRKRPAGMTMARVPDRLVRAIVSVLGRVTSCLLAGVSACRRSGGTLEVWASSSR